MITAGVEVNVFPPVQRSAEKKPSNESFVAQQIMQVHLLLQQCCALRIEKEVIDDWAQKKIARWVKWSLVAD